MATAADGELGPMYREDPVMPFAIDLATLPRYPLLPTLLVHPDGTAELLLTTPELLLGVSGGGSRTDHVVSLPVGGTLLLYTDGLVERRGEVVDDGLARLVVIAETLSTHDLEEFCDALIQRMGYDGDDDMARLALRVHDPQQPRPPEAGPERLH